jgi:hypothetical protein
VRLHEIREAFGAAESTRSGKSGAHAVCEVPLEPLVPAATRLSPRGYSAFLARLSPDALRIARGYKL